MTRRRWLLLALLVALLAAGGGLQWWRIHPEPVFHGAGASMEPDRTTVGDAYSTAIFPAVRHPFTVTITDAEPILREDSTAASVEVLVCTPPSGERADIGYAMSDDWVADRCATVEPAVGGTWTFLDDAHRELFIRVEPRREGTLRLQGVRLSYDVGWQRGVQQAGDKLILKVRP